VDFELDDDQLELQRVVREVVDRECPPALVRAVLAGDDAAGLWKTFVQLDWPSLTVPADDGGMGASPVELAITLEELGRVADPTPFLATTSQYVPLVRACARRIAKLPRRATEDTKRILNMHLERAVLATLDFALTAEDRSFTSPELRANIDRLRKGRQ